MVFLLSGKMILPQTLFILSPEKGLVNRKDGFVFPASSFFLITTQNLQVCGRKQTASSI